ncbi:MAG: zf-TFIIB domain-containing protein [Pirellulales bacterium]
MRLITKCIACERQYDATGRKIGSRFRCHCGEAVRVERPIGHDASVVRCSSCGAPREAEAKCCHFCGSDYTLHERDMHTVCPTCFARVSDRARFCHHCATGLTPELAAGDPTELICPECKQDDQPLVSRRIGELGVTVLECPLCAGMWLGTDTFRHLADRVQRTALRKSPTTPPPAAPGDRQPGRWAYRPCTVCQSLMQRRNFGGSSGVIIDVCRDHGIWFDDAELHHLVAWIRAGGTARKPFESEPPSTSLGVPRRPRTVAEMDRDRSEGRTVFRDGDSLIGTVIAEVVEELASWLRR